METFAKRDWGTWEVLNKGPFYKIKKLIINPGKSISNQYHFHRQETWCIIQGSGELLLGSAIIRIKKGDVVTIEPKQHHKVKNTSEEDFIAIEVQMGDICEEDDIVRIE